MKALIWSLCAVGALLWTGGAWVTTSILRWAAQALASGQARDVSDAIGQWPLPAWLTQWIDVAALNALLDGLRWTMETLQTLWPAIGSVVGWLVPLVWATWALGLLAMLALAGSLHWLARRTSPPAPHAA